MRIGLISHQWPGARMGGVGSYVKQCASALAACGHEPHVFTLTLPDDVRAQIPPGVIVHEVPDLASRVSSGTLPAPLAAAINAGGDGVYRLALGWLLCNAVKQLHAHTRLDAIEAAEVEAMSLPLLLDPMFDAPVVVHLHCSTAVAHAVNQTIDPERTLPALEHASILLADALVAPTRAILRITNENLPFDREATVINYPFAIPESPIVEMPDQGPLVFVGRLEKLKGCELLPEALNLFLCDNPAARFRFIGPDTSTARGGRSIRLHIEQTLHPDVRDRVDFTGEISNAQIERELDRASIAVLPSLWDNHSMAVCEAMSRGRPAIVCERTGSAEIVDECGIVLPNPPTPRQLADAMQTLWRDVSLRRSLSGRCLERIQSICDPAETTRKRIELYRQTKPRSSLDRLRDFPGSIASALLPAMSQVVASLSGVASATQTPGAKLARVVRSHNADRVVLFGAGKFTTRLLAEQHAWNNTGAKVVGLIDDHPRFAQSPEFLGLPVQSLEQAIHAKRSGESIGLIVLSTDTYEDQFWQITAPLRELGVPVARLSAA